MRSTRLAPRHRPRHQRGSAAENRKGVRFSSTEQKKPPRRRFRGGLRGCSTTAQTADRGNVIMTDRFACDTNGGSEDVWPWTDMAAAGESYEAARRAEWAARV